MSDTAEVEIFEVLAESLKSAAEDCEKLAWDPKRGHVYNRFRGAMKLVEGACRQAYYWRDYDARWLALGRLASFVRERSGHWLRGERIAGPQGRIAFTGGTVAHRKRAQPEFKWLADRLRAIHQEAERVKTRATGRRGPLLPAPLPGPHRDTRPVQVATPEGFVRGAGGLYVPAAFRDERAAA